MTAADPTTMAVQAAMPAEMSTARGLTPPKICRMSRIGKPATMSERTKNVRPSRFPSTMPIEESGVASSRSQVLGEDSCSIAPAMNMGVTKQMAATSTMATISKTPPPAAARARSEMRPPKLVVNSTPMAATAIRMAKYRLLMV
jgi:hypothetical protein